MRPPRFLLSQESSGVWPLALKDGSKDGERPSTTLEDRALSERSESNGRSRTTTPHPVSIKRWLRFSGCGVNSQTSAAKLGGLHFTLQELQRKVSTH